MTTQNPDQLRSARFRMDREPGRKRLETLVARADKGGVKSLSYDEARSLATTYRQAMNSLSVARDISLDLALVTYLEQLCSRAYLVVYAPQESIRGLVTRLMTTGIPRAVRRSGLPLLIGFTALFLGAVAGYLLYVQDPGWFFTFVPPEMAEGRTPAASADDLRRTLYGNNGAPGDALGAFASYLFSNNTQIAILVFALGIFLSVPSFLLTFYNGLLIGAFFATFAAKGLAYDLFAWLSIHGVTELAAICIACAGGAQIMDVLITYLGVLLVASGLFWLEILPLSATFSLIVILFFLVRIPYYILAELVWNGRSLGKRSARIRVISADGRRLTPHQITARNLMKEVEFFTPASMLLAVDDLGMAVGLITAVWVLGVVIVPFANRRRQRLGDLVAGTLVVENPKALLLGDLVARAPGGDARFEFLPVHLDVYGRFELQTLEAILRDPAKGPAGEAELARVTDAIIRKIGYAARIAPNDRMDFLMAFCRAQRAHLENRRLFGDRREDKFHKTGAAPVTARKRRWWQRRR